MSLYIRCTARHIEASMNNSNRTYCNYGDSTDVGILPVLNGVGILVHSEVELFGGSLIDSGELCGGVN